MQADENYRPGNLLVGGGGRGVRKAPKEVGTGEWVVVKAPGDPVGELFMKKSAWENMMAKKHGNRNVPHREPHDGHWSHNERRPDNGIGEKENI